MSRSFSKRFENVVNMQRLPSLQNHFASLCDGTICPQRGSGSFRRSFSRQKFKRLLKPAYVGNCFSHLGLKLLRFSLPLLNLGLFSLNFSLQFSSNVHRRIP